MTCECQRSCLMRKAGIDERAISKKVVDIAYDATTTVIGIFTW